MLGIEAFAPIVEPLRRLRAGTQLVGIAVSRRVGIQSRPISLGLAASVRDLDAVTVGDAAHDGFGRLGRGGTDALLSCGALLLSRAVSGGSGGRLGRGRRSLRRR